MPKYNLLAIYGDVWLLLWLTSFFWAYEKSVLQYIFFDSKRYHYTTVLWIVYGIGISVLQQCLMFFTWQDYFHEN